MVRAPSHLRSSVQVRQVLLLVSQQVIPTVVCLHLAVRVLRILVSRLGYRMTCWMRWPIFHRDRRDVVLQKLLPCFSEHRSAYALETLPIGDLGILADTVISFPGMTKRLFIIMTRGARKTLIYAKFAIRMLVINARSLSCRTARLYSC